MCLLDHIKALGLCVCLALLYFTHYWCIILSHRFVTFGSQTAIQYKLVLNSNKYSIFRQNLTK